MENGKDERCTKPNGDARLDYDCGELDEGEASSADSNRETGARCKTKCLPCKMPTESGHTKINSNLENVRRMRRRRRVPGIDKGNRGQVLGDQMVNEISESDEECDQDLQTNGEITQAETKTLNGFNDKIIPLKTKVDVGNRDKLNSFETVDEKCLETREDSEGKGNLSSDSDNDGDVEEEDEEDDGLSADECCIYTYRGDREGTADHSPLFGGEVQDVNGASNVDAIGNVGRRPGEVVPPRCSSPEMDFLEMDFDPGPPTGRDSDESGQESQEADDDVNHSHAGMKSEIPSSNHHDVENISRKDFHPDGTGNSACNSPPSGSLLTAISSAPESSNNVSHSCTALEKIQEKAVASSDGAIGCAASKIKPLSRNVDVSKGAVPKYSVNTMDQKIPRNANMNSDIFEGCRSKQCLDGKRRDMEKAPCSVYRMNGCESVGGAEHGDMMHQLNVVDYAMSSASYNVPVFICLPMQSYSSSETQPKVLHIQSNSNPVHCRGHRKFHGEHASPYSADRGAADVIVNALSALDVSVTYRKVQQGIFMALPPTFSGRTSPPSGLVEYLEWRAHCKGAPSQIEIAQSIAWASDGEAMSRFFPTVSSSDGVGAETSYHSSVPKCTSSASLSTSNKAHISGVNLMDWLYYWMKRGAIPIVTFNSQDWIDCMKSGVENPDHSRMCDFSDKYGIGTSRGSVEEGEKWVHQMVIALGPRGAYLSGCANEQCCAEVRSLACLLVSGVTKGVRIGRAEVVARWRTGSNDLRPLLNPKIPQWRRANVLGAVVSAVRESCASMPRSSSSSSSSTSSSASATPPAVSPASPLGLSSVPSTSTPTSNSPYIVLPVARHRTGITLVLRSDSDTVEELLAASETSLSQILTPSADNPPKQADSSSNLSRSPAYVPPINGKNHLPTNIALSVQQTRQQDSV